MTKNSQPRKPKLKKKYMNSVKKNTRLKTSLDFLYLSISFYIFLYLSIFLFIMCSLKRGLLQNSIFEASGAAVSSKIAWCAMEVLGVPIVETMGLVYGKIHRNPDI